jgi:hypothetical protein|nr:MAG TPA: hypothetical protein [Bacteriophage sp.]
MYDELKIGYFCFSDSAKIGDEKKTNPTTRIAILKPEVFLITVFHSDEIFYSRNSNLTAITLAPANWTGTSAPYSYVISNSKITTTNVLDLIINANTQDLIDAIGSYKISGYKQETGKVTIYAWGEKPSMNLSATLVVRGGL